MVLPVLQLALLLDFLIVDLTLLPMELSVLFLMMDMFYLEQQLPLVLKINGLLMVLLVLLSLLALLGSLDVKFMVKLQLQHALFLKLVNILLVLPQLEIALQDVMNALVLLLPFVLKPHLDNISKA